MSLTCFLIESFWTKFTFKHLWLFSFLYFFDLLYFLFTHFSSSHLLHSQPQAHWLLFPVRNTFLLDFNQVLFLIYVNSLLLFLKMFNCSFVENLCLAELNSFLLLIKIFLQIFWCLARDCWTNDLPHYLHGKRVG